MRQIRSGDAGLIQPLMRFHLDSSGRDASTIGNVRAPVEAP
jgi:hypothetical protein